MSDQLWVIRGFKHVVKNKTSSEIINTAYHGEFTEDTSRLIMEGYTLNDTKSKEGYSTLEASMQPVEKYQALPLADKGMGAVVGGFIYKTNKTSHDPYVKEQEWGVVDDEGRSTYVANFYGTKKKHMYYVQACFDTTGATAVSGFWRNSSLLAGQDVENEKYNWGNDIHAYPDDANYAISLVPAIETTVVDVHFPTVEEEMKSVKTEVVSDDTYINSSAEATLTETFEIDEEVSDTASFSFTAGVNVATTTGWSVTVPLIGTSFGGMQEQEASFEPGSYSAVTSTKTIKRTQEVEVPPMTSVTAHGFYSKGVLSIDKVILIVQDTYKNGIVKTYQTPAGYKGVSAFDDKIEIDDAVPISDAR